MDKNDGAEWPREKQEKGVGDCVYRWGRAADTNGHGRREGEVGGSGALWRLGGHDAGEGAIQRRRLRGRVSLHVQPAVRIIA